MSLWTYTSHIKDQGTRLKQQQKQSGVYPKRAHCFVSVTCCEMDTCGQPSSAAQRRLRSWWRHEQQSIAAALATCTHHSAQRKKTARAGAEVRVAADGEVPEAPLPQPELFSLYEEEPALAEPPGPQERVQRHTVEQMADSAPSVQIIDASVPQMVDQLVKILKNDVEQVINVPKIILLDYTPQRAVPRVPQLAQQLVEVPMVQSAIVARVRDASGQAWLESVGARGVS